MWDFYSQGIVRVDDERLDPFVGKRSHHVQAILSGKRWIDQETIAKGLSDWIWPLHFLDFETINFALPRFPAAATSASSNAG